MTKSDTLVIIVLSWISFMVGSISLLSFVTSIANQYPIIGIAFGTIYLVALYFYFRLLGKAITLYQNGK